MRKRSIIKASAAPMVLALALVSAPAQAQDTSDSAPDCVDSDANGTCDSDETTANAAGNTIVVTGSRIRRPDEFSTADPVTVINNEEMTQAGFTSTTEALQSNQITQGGEQINNYFGGFVTNGGTGANTVGLRGLGSERTLLLLNGRRLAPAGTRGSVGSVDTNILPISIVERIEVLKSGASSIYGSDAVAGVINVITDSDAEGLTLEGQISAPEVGAGLTRRLAAILGYNSDRFKISAALEYSKRARLSRNDVDFTRCPTNMRLTGEGSVPGSGDFIDPATGKAKCFPLGGGGVTINTLGVSTREAQAAPGTPGTRFNRLRPNANAMGGTPGYEGVNLDSRDTFDPEQEFEDLVTPAEIYTGFLQASYQTDILGNAEAYVEILGNQRKSSSLLYRQLGLDYEEGSPLIPDEFQDSILREPTATTNGNNVGVRAFIGFGNLRSRQEVDFAKIGGGLRGDFFIPGWRYDAYASKSWSDGTYEQETFLTDRMAKASNVVRNADGSFSCTTTSDPDCVAQPYLTPAVIGGNLPQAYRDYITANVTGIPLTSHQSGAERATLSAMKRTA